MSKRFLRGLVIGKFSPLHRGHELLIRRALEECGEVFVISYSKPEFAGCEATRREQWLAALFPAARRLVVTDSRLKESIKPGAEFGDVPANDLPATVHRRFCAFLCQEVFRVTVDAVFTSEDYGDGLAAELTRSFREGHVGAPAVTHVLVDPARSLVPVSGTALRHDIHGHRSDVSPVVYASFVKRVCLLGGESTGKTTLAHALAREFDTCHVPEYGRELWEKKAGALEFEDFRIIAETQVAREEAAILHARRQLFCDTSPMTTLFYSQHLFGRTDPEVVKLARRPYDVTILCAPDFEFVQDGTRQAESFRRLQHEWYQRELSAIPFLTVSGPVATRIRQVAGFLDQANSVS